MLAWQANAKDNTAEKKKKRCTMREIKSQSHTSLEMVLHCFYLSLLSLAVLFNGTDIYKE